MPCDEVGYQQYFTEVAAKVGTGRAPLNAIIELTERCNLQCQHCYIHDPAQDHLVRSRELTTEQWFRIFDQLAEAGCLWMTWTGGEILLRPDFADLYCYAKRKGFLIVLFTNGTLLTPDLVALFQEWYPHYMEITLYGMTAGTYERVTGVRGTFELQAMYDYAASLGIEFRHDSVIRPTFHGQDIRHLRLPPDEVVELDYVRPDAEDALRDNLQSSLDAVEDNPLYDPERLYNCGAGFRTFHIAPYGQLTMCHMIRSPGCDLTQYTFEEGWEGLSEMRSVRVSKDFACLSCGIRGLCTCCPAFASLENGDSETTVHYACAIAHLRAERLGVMV
jgi:radical SAM protein with 4Fe4S-binding SPASM domain